MPKRDQARAKKPRRRMGRPALLAALGLAVLLVGLALFLPSRKTSVHLAASVPEDVSYFVEFSSLARTLDAMASMKIVPAAKVAPAATAEDAVVALEKAFDLTRDDAEALAKRVVGVAVAGRFEGKDTRSAWLVGVSSSAPVDALLMADRFASQGRFGESGRAYTLAPAAFVDGAPLLERGLRDLSATGPGKKVVWFKDARILAWGDDALLHDIAAVIDSGKPALDRSELYRRGRRTGAAPDGAIFLDEGALRVLAANRKEPLDGTLRDGGALVGSVRVLPAGVLVSATATLTGDALPAAATALPAKRLTYPDRLPAETVLYVAGSMKHGLKPADARVELTRLLAAGRSFGGDDVARELVDLGKAAGVSLEDLFEMAGDEAAFAIVADKSFKYGAGTPLLEAALRDAGMLLVMKVDGDAAAQRVLARLREAIASSEIGPVSTVTPDRDGFVVTVSPRASLLLGGPPPTLRARYAHREVALVVAAPDLVKATFAALDGERSTLKDDPAHTLARGALRPDAHLYAWVDVGRVGAVAYRASPEARESAQRRGFPVDAVNLEGPDRITAAADLDYHVSGGVWTVDVETLNLWGAGLIVSWQAVPRHPTPSTAPAASAVPSAPPLDRRPVFLHALEDMPDCGRYLTVLATCASHTTGEAQEAYLHDAAVRKDDYVRTVPVDRPLQDKACLGNMFKLRTKPECRF